MIHLEQFINRHKKHMWYYWLIFLQMNSEKNSRMFSHKTSMLFWKWNSACLIRGLLTDVVYWAVYYTSLYKVFVKQLFFLPQKSDDCKRFKSNLFYMRVRIHTLNVSVSPDSSCSYGSFSSFVSNKKAFYTVW